VTQIEVIVQLKKEVLDPEARAIKDVLHRRVSDSIKDVHVSKRFVLSINAPESEAMEVAGKIAREYLSNPVAQTFELKKV